MLTKILSINWLLTIVFNLHYFPFLTALKFPCIIMRHTVLRKMGGVILLPEYERVTGRLIIGGRYLGSLDHCYGRTIWEVEGTVIIKGMTSVGCGSRVCVGKNATLSLGDHFVISGNSMILCSKSITIGDNVLFSWDILVMDDDQHPIFNIDGEHINPTKSVNIGDNVWVGCRSTILKGSFIPAGSIVASASVITKKIEKDNCIISGSSEGIKYLKSNVTWKY